MKLAIKTNKTVDITDLIPKFVVFFDASLPATITRDANNKISGWLDRSLNKFDATQPILANQPTYTAFNNFFGISCPSLNLSNNGFLRFSIDGNFGAINGTLYIATDKYVLQAPINIANSSNQQTFELTGGTANLLTAIILVNGSLTSDEESKLGTYLSMKGSNSRSLTSLNMEFSAETVGGLYINPLIKQITGLNTLESFNTSNLINLDSAFRKLNNITVFPLIDTSRVTSINQTWNGLTSLNSFPGLNLGNVVNATSAWASCRLLQSFPFVNLSKANNIAYAWFDCVNLTIFPAMDFRACTSFQEAWRTCKLNQASVDEILISIAAGLANNPTKILAANGGSLVITGGTSSAPGVINRRENWANRNSWEFNLSQINESIEGTTYDFRSGITGRQAKAWLAAKGWAIATN